jgi:hypothetical protein
MKINTEETEHFCSSKALIINQHRKNTTTKLGSAGPDQSKQSTFKANQVL